MASSAESLSENPAQRVQLDLLGGGQVIEPKPKRTRKPRVAKDAATPTPEPPPDPGPPDAADPVTEALAAIQHEDTIGLELGRALGKRPGVPACREAGIDGAWGLQRWKQIKGLDPEALLANQQELAKTRTAQVAEMAAGVDAAKAERASRTELTDEEATALKAKRGCDDKRIQGIARIREVQDLPEGFRHWGAHAHKLVPCDAIPWACASGRVVIQLNPDEPPVDQTGRAMKYLFPKGCGGLVGVLQGSEQLVLDPDVPLVVVEGTYQGRAVATALEGSSNPYAVVQVSGCNGWMTGGAPSPEFAHIPLRGREVFFLPDADVKTNRAVYDAAKYLRENLLDEYLAKDVRIVHLPGRGNDGADDVLSRHDFAHNQEMVLRWLDKARGKAGLLSAKPPRKPRRDSGFFTEQGQFQPVDFWKYLQQQHYLALTGDKAIALYEGGVYRNSDSRRWNRAVEEALGNDYVPQYLNTVTEIAHSSLKVAGKEVPVFLPEPLLNLANGLLDLRTGELREHSPEVVTTTQLPVVWDPDAKCPTWEAVIGRALPGQLERLEDVMSQALDWTRSPIKILLLYGASRAGKGLILRVLEQLMGRGNYSAVTLHQLADDRFMVAELYGKRANIAGELKPEEVRDISAVKMLTGEDPIQANKKYGATFTFYSYAFLAFSCNKLPPINETTRAFTSRAAPFRFTVGYDGCEDQTLGAKLSAELPGILVRLVRAWQRRNKRGTFMPVDAATKAHFDENIDHVARFLADATVRLEAAADGMKRSELFPLWQDWCRDQNLVYAARTSKQTFHDKVRNQGVNDGKDRKGIYRWPLKARTDDGDSEGPEGPDDGGNPAVDGDDGKKAAVTKTPANTGESGERRQRRQPSGKTSANKKPPAEKPSPDLVELPKVTERYGKGCQKVAVTAVTPQPPFGPLPPADELVPADHTGPLLFDLETRSVDELFDPVAPGGRPFITLVGTPYGQNTDPTALVEYVKAGGTLVAHNGFGFDFLALALHHGLDLLAAGDNGQLIDTMVLAMLREDRIFTLSKKKDIGENYKRNWSLNALAKRYSGVGKTDDIKGLAIAAAKAAGHRSRSQPTLVKIGLALIDPGSPQLQDYLRGDIAALQAIADHYGIDNLRPYEQREMKIQARLTCGVCLQGIRVDEPLVERRIAEMEVEAEAGRKWLGGQGFSLVSAEGKALKRPLGNPANKELLGKKLQSLGVRKVPKTEKGAVSTGKEGLGPLLQQAEADNNHDLVQLIETVLMLSGQAHIYGTLREVLNNGAVHPSISTPQASGRCSITKPAMTVFGKRGDHLLAQRATILPDSPADVLWACDLCQIDMRAMAVHSQDPNYLSLFLPGLDPATGKPYDAHQGIADRLGITRKNAKVIGHGWNYGMELKRMIEDGIDPDLARDFIRGMERAFPTLVSWKAIPRRQGERPRNRLDNGFGRPMQCNPRRAHTMAPSLMGQGTARDLMMECLLRLPAEIAGMLRIQVHDELVFNLPRDRAQELADQIQDLMTFQWAPCPDVQPVWVLNSSTQFGDNWADCYQGQERLRLVDEVTGERFWFWKE